MAEATTIRKAVAKMTEAEVVVTTAIKTMIVAVVADIITPRGEAITIIVATRAVVITISSKVRAVAVITARKAAEIIKVLVGGIRIVHQHRKVGKAVAADDNF